MIFPACTGDALLIPLAKASASTSHIFSSSRKSATLDTLSLLHMVPLPMNEFLQENLSQACGREGRVQRRRMAGAAHRQPLGAGRPRRCRGAVSINVSSPSSDAGILARYFLASSWSPNGFNWEHWKDDQFEAAMKTLVGGDASRCDFRRLPARARADGGRPAVALHRARPQSARVQQEGARLRPRAELVRRSDRDQRGLTPAVTHRPGSAGPVLFAQVVNEMFHNQSPLKSLCHHHAIGLTFRHRSTD